VANDPRDEFLRYVVKRVQEAKNELTKLESPGVVSDPEAIPSLQAEIKLLEQYIELATEKSFTRDDFLRDLRKVSEPQVDE
jgi:hypothetical protein